MPDPTLNTLREALAWSYANLACTHSALKAGRIKHAQIDWIIRAKLFRGLKTGEMQLGSLFDDERLTLIAQPNCVYCGVDGALSIDHIVPRAAGGGHEAHNLVRACRPCNSSKGKRDLLEWFNQQGRFPPILLLRRYLKLLDLYACAAGLLDYALTDDRLMELPFAIDRLPGKFPNLRELRL